MYQPKELYSTFQLLKIEEKLSASIGEKITIDSTDLKCLKSTTRSSIYKLVVSTKHDSFPLIFKTYSKNNYKNDIEINMYTKGYSKLKSFFPIIYLVEEYKEETWIFMEFVQQVRGQLVFTPKHFQSIIPSVAKLHANTFDSHFNEQAMEWSSWLPIYDSFTMRKERSKAIANTMNFLQESSKNRELKSILSPHKSSLYKIYEKGPDFFPELLESGSALTHGDLHMQNICSHETVKNGPWPIQFIDWESAKYAPSWLDLIVLVELLIAFRKDWQKDGNSIRTECIKAYLQEMKKHGISFKENPTHLYKMAYLQRTLEKGLQTQLRRIYENRGGELLPYHLHKLKTWGKDLGIYK